MKSFFSNLYVFIFLLYIPAVAWGQWDNGQKTVHLSIPEVALIDVEPGINTPIHFEVTPATESGTSSQIEKVTDEDLWINYSSALRAGQNSRSITAEVSQGQIPSGIKMFLEASSISGGKGNCGISSGKIELSEQPRSIISEIGNCYTGDGINSGHQLVFSIEISDYPELKSSGESNLLVVYTLTDN